MAKGKGGPHRLTEAERAAHADRHPELDTRPRYADGSPALAEDLVQAGGHGGTARLLWTEVRQEVPVRRWTAVLAGAGSVPLESLSLISRTDTDGCRADRCWCRGSEDA